MGPRPALPCPIQPYHPTETRESARAAAWRGPAAPHAAGALPLVSRSSGVRREGGVVELGHTCHGAAGRTRHMDMYVRASFFVLCVASCSAIFTSPFD